MKTDVVPLSCFNEANGGEMRMDKNQGIGDKRTIGDTQLINGGRGGIS